MRRPACSSGRALNHDLFRATIALANPGKGLWVGFNLATCTTKTGSDHSFENGVLSDILGTDAYIEADEKARSALARGDAEMVKSALMPFAEEIKKFQATARYALAATCSCFSPANSL